MEQNTSFIPATPGPSGVIQTSDSIRAKITEQYELFKPHLAGYHEYATRVAALSLEYHGARLKEAFPNVPIEELVTVATLNAHETPKSLDIAVTEMVNAGAAPRRIIFDRVKGTYTILA